MAGTKCFADSETCPDLHALPESLFLINFRPTVIKTPCKVTPKKVAAELSPLLV